MKYFTGIALIIAINTATVHPSQAQQTINLAGVEYHHNLVSNTGNPGFYDFKAKATVPISYGDDYLFAALPRYNQTLYSDLGFGLPSHLIRRINVPFIYQHKISEGRSIGGILSPGIHSDFEDISSEDWVFFAALFLRNTKNSAFHFRYGLVYIHQVNGMIIIPAIMFNWQPTDRITVDNRKPLSPEFSYDITKSFTTGFTFRRRGGSSRLSKDFKSKTIKDIRYELAPYIDYKIWDKFILRGTFGYTFNRKVQMFENKDVNPTWYRGLRNIDPLKEHKYSGWFFNLGLRLSINRNQ